MSIQAISFAFAQKLPSCHLKFIFICFANYANEEGLTWCSANRLQQMTGMDIKTVGKWVRQLEVSGFLTDTGERRGETSRVKVYKIASFETQPKTTILEKNVLGEFNTPETGDTPTPPIKNNLKSKPKEKIYNKKSNKVTLAEWEQKVGSRLCTAMMDSWIKDARADAVEIALLITEFREKVTAGGNVYADFAAAFKVWLRQGYLSKKLMQVQRRDLRAPSGEAQVWETGSAL